MPFSIDLRSRVVTAIDNGMSASDAAALFNVSRRVVYTWLDLRKKTDSIKPKSGYQKGHSHKITDWDKFKEFAEYHRKYTAPRMIIEWEKLTQVKVSESVMHRALRKIGFTFKKNIWLCRS